MEGPCRNRATTHRIKPTSRHDANPGSSESSMSLQYLCAHRFTGTVLTALLLSAFESSPPWQVHRLLGPYSSFPRRLGNHQFTDHCEQHRPSQLCRARMRVSQTDLSPRPQGHMSPFCVPPYSPLCQRPPCDSSRIRVTGWHANWQRHIP